MIVIISMRSNYKHKILCNFFEDITDLDQQFTWPKHYNKSGKVLLIDKLVKYFEQRDLIEDYEKCNTLLNLRKEILKK